MTEADSLPKAEDLLSEGRRHLLCDRASDAVEALSEACELFDSIHGEGNEKCAQIYFWYGSALLELGRAEHTVLGESVAPNTQDENSTDESKETPEETNSENDDDNKENEQQPPDNEDNASGDDEEDSFKSSWQMLELCRTLLENRKAGDFETDELLCRAYLKLGELLMETGHHEEATDEFRKCCSLQKKVFQGASRQLAETYFLAGVNEICKQSYHEALNNFTLSKETIEACIVNMKSIEQDVSDLESLLPLVVEKLDDVRECIRSTDSVRSLDVSTSNGFESSSSSQTSLKRKFESQLTNGELKESFNDVKPTSNINHLVKRKPVTEASAEKRTKVD